MAYARRNSGLPRSRRGHAAHTRMRLSPGNPMAKGGNFRRSGSSGRRGRVVTGSRRKY